MHHTGNDRLNLRHVARWLATATTFVLVLSGCIELGQEWSDKHEIREVDYYKEQCDNDSSELCFRIREDSSDSWEVVEEPFTGFDDYVWGQRHDVDVQVSFNDDGSTSSYVVTGLNASETVDSSEDTFAINLYTQAGILVQNNDTNWQLGGEISFDCGVACDALEKAVANQYATRLEFVLTDGDVPGIELNSVICASSEDDFSSDCEGESKVSWIIGWFQSDCGLAEASMCLVYKVNSSDDFELLQLEDGIDGFTPEWGSQYSIDVIKTVSDGGNITKVTLEDDDSNPDSYVGSSNDFRMILRGSELKDPDSNNLVTIYDADIDLDCTGACSDFSGLEDDEWMLVRVYVDGEELRLYNTGSDSICIDDSLADFRDNCIDDHDDVTWGI